MTRCNCIDPDPRPVGVSDESRIGDDERYCAVCHFRVVTEGATV